MGKKKILLVDDEQHHVMTVKSRLEKEGYAVIVATDGMEAIKKAQTEHPDLVILDLILPKLNGYEVCTKLRLDPRSKAIPIIMFTVKATDLEKEVGMAAGANAYVRKPFDPDELLGTVRSLLTSSTQPDKAKS